MTLEEGQRKYKQIMERDAAQKSKEPKKRNPYRRGAKAYLASFNVGETREYNEVFCWDNLRSIACHMKSDFGCQFTFCKDGLTRYITRLI